MHARWMWGTAALCAAMAAGTAAAAAQDRPASPVVVSPADAAARISGAWELNADLSSDANAAESAVQLPRGGGSGDASGSSGGSYRGGRGGRGGFAPRGGTAAPTQAQIAEMQAIVDEVRRMPDHLALHATPTTLTLLLADGSIRKFSITDQSELINYGTAEVNTITRWESGVLTQDLIAGQIKIAVTYQLSDDGKHLVIAFTVPKAAGRGANGGDDSSAPAGPTVIKHVYDHQQ